jgi:hypothetical protein
MRKRAAPTKKRQIRISVRKPVQGTARSRGELAGIGYAGLSGVSQECHQAVARLLQCGEGIARVRILSCKNSHCLLLTSSIGDLTAVKSGFSSGYLGAGPTYFSLTLQFLISHGAEIEEYEVAESVMERLDASGLTTSDVKALDGAREIRPRRWQDYIHQDDVDSALKGELWRKMAPIIPFGIVDHRLIDLALSFWEAPDDRLLKAYRRLEDIIRARASLDDHGQKLFSRAFGASPPLLS